MKPSYILNTRIEQIEKPKYKVIYEVKIIGCRYYYPSSPEKSKKEASNDLLRYYNKFKLREHKNDFIKNTMILHNKFKIKKVIATSKRSKNES